MTAFIWVPGYPNLHHITGAQTLLQTPQVLRQAGSDKQ